MSKKINLIANYVLPIVVIAITITLFFMFKPHETTALFYLNLGYTIFLEAVFFGYLNLLYAKVKEFSSPFLAVFGVYAIYYVVIGFVCMLAYSLILSHFLPIKFYVAALMVLTLLWIIISVLTAQTDSNYKETVEKLKDDTHTLNFYTQKINLLANRYEKLCTEKGLKYETDSNNRTTLDRLKGKISFLTPNILNNDTAVSQLTSLFNKCEDIIEETESATDDTLVEAQKKMQRFVDNAIAEIDMLKNLTRR
ncbi:MAG: hypothetical protein FWF53_10150 [Candidatus Azobacteroides sp.]|nr:hypothetical protein [Candidatus Azobacteroides sp.]